MTTMPAARPTKELGRRTRAALFAAAALMTLVCRQLSGQTMKPPGHFQRCRLFT